VAEVVRSPGVPPTEGDAASRLRAEGLEPRAWRSGPGDEFAWHRHASHKVLVCVDGAIVFHLDGREVALEPGDRLELAAGVDHAATVGPRGVRCVEAFRPEKEPRNSPVG
jgi:quercetin dioxygenase-like cupin family protein